jgi:hypothetical protein
MLAPKKRPASWFGSLRHAGVGEASEGNLRFMSQAAQRDDQVPHGTSLLPRDLDEAQLAAAPTLGSVDALLIDDLTVEEDDAFFAAIGS